MDAHRDFSQTSDAFDDCLPIGGLNALE